MKDKLISDKLSDNQMLEDLQRLLDEELSKPLEERDLDAIKEITDAVISINDEEVPKSVSAETILGEVDARKKRGRIIQLRKWTAILAACFVICIAANIYTINTFGANVVETVMKIAKSGFSVDLNELRDIEADPAIITTEPPFMTTGTYMQTGTLATTETTATTAAETWAMSASTFGMTTVPAATQTTAYQPSSSGGSATVPTPGGSGTVDRITANCNEYSRDMAREILTKCEEHGIYPCYPETLPYYFGSLVLDEYHFEQMKDSDDMYFTFTDGENSLDIIIEDYVSAYYMPDVLIPSDEYEYETFKNGSISGIVIDEGYGTTIVFVKGNTVYTLHGSGMYKNAWVEAAMGFVPYPSEFIKK
ncbi:DUF4367 domain-containing protein [Ruminococcus flavefaciens]|uniref:DUF4367 domain-containing protein n=1 Tax=Ruminococcus flavefaciens TaxID=1265 RepID=UPI00048A99A1|nr:DUF4367 domain-containing protein [Ruminococcus flavefaciens]